MRFRNTLRYDLEDRRRERDSRNMSWHKWYAWFPVKVWSDNGRTEYVWLEEVNRCLSWGYNNEPVWIYGS